MRGGGGRRQAAGLLAGALLGAAGVHATCTIERLPDIPVTMESTVPMVHAQLNGRDARFIADSGAFFSMITPGAATQFDMRADPRYRPGEIRGIGGEERATVMRARSFTIMGMTLSDVDFIVAGNNVHSGAGLLGQNVFRLGDVEYDLANGVIRIVRPKDCKDSALAYWAGAASKPYSVIDIDVATAREPHTMGVAYLNGTKIHVMFDTGAARSVLTLSAAKHAGVTPQSPGVEPAGLERGIGNRSARSWIARFASFKVGDEEIEHARLRFADIALNSDMLIGADFFLSHRIYVASSQRKLYFTYNGGRVFDLETTREAPEPSAAGAEPAAADNPAPAPPPDMRLNQPGDAAGFARRGAASAARHDYAAAIADLTRACELAPTDPGYFYQRAVLYEKNAQGGLALADLDKAIKLKPDDPQSLVARAALRAARRDSAGAAADLQAADRLAAKDSDERLQIASVYETIDNPAAARAQYSQWIDSHPHSDTRRAGVLNLRCRTGALSGQALSESLADCNAALRIRPREPGYLDSRGLVEVRLGNYDKAIEDYDAALKVRPNIAWSLYGRGLAKLRKGQSAAGEADLAAAKALQPGIAERAARFALSP